MELLFGLSKKPSIVVRHILERAYTSKLWPLISSSLPIIATPDHLDSLKIPLLFAHELDIKIFQPYVFSFSPFSRNDTVMLSQANIRGVIVDGKDTGHRHAS